MIPIVVIMAIVITKMMVIKMMVNMRGEGLADSIRDRRHQHCNFCHLQPQLPQTIHALCIPRFSYSYKGGVAVPPILALWWL